MGCMYGGVSWALAKERRNACELTRMSKILSKLICEVESEGQTLILCGQRWAEEQDRKLEEEENAEKIENCKKLKHYKTLEIDTIRIQVLMAERGLNYSQLANNAGLARSTLYLFCKKSQYRLSTLSKIAAALDVEPAALLKKEDKT